MIVWILFEFGEKKYIFDLSFVMFMLYWFIPQIWEGFIDFVLFCPSEPAVPVEAAILVLSFILLPSLVSVARCSGQGSRQIFSLVSLFDHVGGFPAIQFFSFFLIRFARRHLSASLLPVWARHSWFISVTRLARSGLHSSPVCLCAWFSAWFLREFSPLSKFRSSASRSAAQRSVSASDNSPHYFRFPLRAASGRSASFLVVFSVRCCMWIVVRTRLCVIFELSDQKARGFLVSIALNRLLPEHACKMFGEMLVRTWTEFLSNFCRQSRMCSYQY
jgi:hypothetical protein